MKLGEALEKRRVAPHIYKSREEAKKEPSNRPNRRPKTTLVVNGSLYQKRCIFWVSGRLWRYPVLFDLFI